jgi:biotin carboxylase
MSKRLLVLGASRYQLPTITAAVRLGHEVVVVDNNPENPGHGIAEKSYVVSTADISEVLRIASNEDVDGVIAPCTDVAVLTASFVSSALGLAGVDENAARVLTDKVLFRALLRDLGIPHPSLLREFSGDEQGRILNQINQAVIIKPNKASGSRGVRIVYESRERQDMQVAIQTAQANSMDGKALIEELVKGSHHSAEGVVLAGELLHVTVTERLTVDPPYTATRGHIVLPEQGVSLNSQLRKAILNLFSQLKVSNSVFDCDFVVTSDGTVMILELTPRLGGNLLSELVQEACGVDMVKVAIDLALGEKPMLTADTNSLSAAAVILGLNHDGVAQWSPTGVEEALQHPLVKRVSFDIPNRTSAKRFTDGRSRVGEVVISRGSLTDVRTLIDEVLSLIELRAS